jgi:hypothetical protein
MWGVLSRPKSRSLDYMLSIITSEQGHGPRQFLPNPKKRISMEQIMEHFAWNAVELFHC